MYVANTTRKYSGFEDAERGECQEKHSEKMYCSMSESQLLAGNGIAHAGYTACDGVRFT